MDMQKDDLKKLMRDQIKTLGIFCKKEEKIRNFIYEKKWRELENVIKEMSPLSEKLESQEKRRNKAFNRLKKNLGQGNDAGFYQVIVKLPENERDIYSELYRNLKIAALKIRAVTNGINTHVRAANGILRDIIEEVYPHKLGDLYSRSGGKIPVSIDSPMVLNREL